MGQVFVTIAAALGLLLGGVGGYQLGHLTGRVAGRAALLQEQAVAAVEAERNRTKDDATLRDLSDVDLCERSLRARGLPIGTCAGLRRVP